MIMVVFIVFLQKQKKKIIVKKEWIQDPKLKVVSTFFYSNEKSEKADFTLKIEEEFDPLKKACYRGQLFDEFSE